MPARLAVLLALVSCSRPFPTRAPALEALQGRFRVVSASSPPTGLTIGTLLEVTEREVVVINDARDDWARYRVQWTSPPDPLARSGVLASGEQVLLRVVGGTLEVLEDGALLGNAERLEGGEEEQASRRFSALPTFAAVVATARACFAQYAQLLPESEGFRDVQPERWATTASGRALLRLAEMNLARACKSVPAACVLEPHNPEQLSALKAAADGCRR